jgi:hypothetical protein
MIKSGVTVATSLARFINQMVSLARLSNGRRPQSLDADPSASSLWTKSFKAFPLLGMGELIEFKKICKNGSCFLGRKCARAM